MSKQPSYFSTFKSACQNGRSPWQCVQTIASKTRYTENQIWSQLCKAKLAFCKTINGKRCYFPTNFKKGNSKNWNQTQFNFCWWAIEYCLQHKWCTPEQIYSWTPNQICWFVCNCISKNMKKPKGFNPNKKVVGFPNSFSTSTNTKKKSTTKKNTKKRTTTSKKRKTTTAKKRKTSTSKRRPTTAAKRRKPTTASKNRKRRTTATRNYKFSTARGRSTSTSRRYRRAA